MTLNKYARITEKMVIEFPTKIFLIVITIHQQFLKSWKFKVDIDVAINSFMPKISNINLNDEKDCANKVFNLDSENHKNKAYQFRSYKQK